MRQASPNQVKLNPPRLSTPSTDSSTLAKDAIMTKNEIWSMVSRDMTDDHSLSNYDDNNSLSSKVSMASTGSYGSLSSAFSAQRRASGNKPPKSPSSSLKSSPTKNHASKSPSFSFSSSEIGKKKPNMKVEQSTKTLKHSNKTQQQDFDDLEDDSIKNDSLSEKNSTSDRKYPIKRWAAIASSAAASIFKGSGSRELAKITTQAVLSSEMNGCPMDMVHLAPVAAEACTAVLISGGSRKSATQTIVMILTNYEVCGSVSSSNVTSSASKKDERENIEERSSVSEVEYRDDLKNAKNDPYNREYIEEYTNTMSQKAYQCYEQVSDGTIYKINDPNEVCKGCVSIPITTLVNKVSDAIEDTGKSITRSFSRVIKETASLDKAYRSNNYLNALIPRSRSNPETTMEKLNIAEKMQKRDTSDLWEGVGSVIFDSSDEEDTETEEDSQQADHPQGYDDTDIGSYNVSVQGASQNVEISTGKINMPEEGKAEKGILDTQITNYGKQYENSSFTDDSLHGNIDNDQFIVTNNNEIAMAMSNLTSEYYDSYHGDDTNNEPTSHPVVARADSELIGASINLEVLQQYPDAPLHKNHESTSHPAAASTDSDIIGTSINPEVLQQDPDMPLQQQPSKKKHQRSSFYRMKRGVGKKLVRLVGSKKRNKEEVEI